MKKEKKKDEPFSVYSIRLKPEDVEYLKKEVLKVTEHYNKRLPDGYKKFKRNQIAFEALKLGLPLLKKKKAKYR